MHDSTSTAGRPRPRVRRSLGALVAVAALAGPLAMAPSARASGGPLDGTPDLLTATVAALPHTLAYPLGGGAGGYVACPSGYVDGLSSLLTCDVIVPLAHLLKGDQEQTSPPSVTSKAKAKAKKRKAAHRSKH